MLAVVVAMLAVSGPSQADPPAGVEEAGRTVRVRCKASGPGLKACSVQAHNCRTKGEAEAMTRSIELLPWNPAYGDPVEFEAPCNARAFGIRLASETDGPLLANEVRVHPGRTSGSALTAARVIRGVDLLCKAEVIDGVGRVSNCVVARDECRKPRTVALALDNAREARIAPGDIRGDGMVRLTTPCNATRGGPSPQAARTPMVGNPPPATPPSRPGPR